MTEFARELTMRVLKSIKSPDILCRLERVDEPISGEVCYILDDAMNVHPVKIKAGQLWGTRGLSNFWTWINLESGEEERGYGGFFKIAITSAPSSAAPIEPPASVPD